jgi:hypothetical protein
MSLDISAEQSQPKKYIASYVPAPRSADAASFPDGGPCWRKNLRVSDG